MPQKRVNRQTGSRQPDRGIGANKSLLDHDDLLKFSYKYTNLSHNVFHFNDRDVSYFVHVIQRLHDLCRYRVLELKTSKSSALRFHPIHWNDTTQRSFGLPHEDQLVEEPYQFSVSVNEHGRIHGFFIDNVFYIVWFDPYHRLYV